MLLQETGFFTQTLQFTTTTFPNLILKPHFLRNTTVLREPKERPKWYTSPVSTLNDGVDAKMAIKVCPTNVDGCVCVRERELVMVWKGGGGFGSLVLALSQRHRIELLVLIVVDVKIRDPKHHSKRVLVGQFLIF